MTILNQVMGFVHVPTQRTGYVTDGPFGEYDHDGPRGPDGRKQYLPNTVCYAVKWDDTGEDGDVLEHEIEWVSMNKRHITDGKRTCHCGPSTIDGLTVHRGTEDLN